MIGKTNAISGVSAPVPKIKTVSGSVISISDALAQPAESLVVGIEPVQSGSGDPSPSNVRPISGWSNVNVYREEQYDAGATPYATINLNGTRYGCTLNVTTGVLTVDRAMVDMGTLTYGKSSSTSAVGGTVFNIAVSNVGSGMATRVRYDPNTMISEIFATASDSVWDVNQIPDLTMSVRSSTLYIADSRYTDRDTFKTAMSGVQLVYELATPQTVQLTPTEIQMLLGNNTLWVDSGDSELQYWARR